MPYVSPATVGGCLLWMATGALTMCYTQRTFAEEETMAAEQGGLMVRSDLAASTLPQEHVFTYDPPPSPWPVGTHPPAQPAQQGVGCGHVGHWPRRAAVPCRRATHRARAPCPCTPAPSLKGTHG